MNGLEEGIRTPTGRAPLECGVIVHIRANRATINLNEVGPKSCDSFCLVGFPKNGDEPGAYC
jgi:hypothetical protein